jgi:hypothetical protein
MQYRQCQPPASSKSHHDAVDGPSISSYSNPSPGVRELLCPQDNLATDNILIGLFTNVLRDVIPNYVDSIRLERDSPKAPSEGGSELRDR